MKQVMRGAGVLQLLLLFLLTSGVQVRAADDRFPEPDALEAAVGFWMRVYLEVGTDGGLLHDSRHLGVVYETLDFGGIRDRRARQRRVDARRRHWRKVLHGLARGHAPRDHREQLLVTSLQRALGRPPRERDYAAAAGHIRFQAGQRDKFVAGLARAGAWEGRMRAIFRRMGLPEDLALLPHVESSFNPRAYSKYGAAGMWQFMRSTGRRYLRIDYLVDERLDPLQATRAAARLLRDNYRKLGTWPLAITAYNHGAAGMERARRETGSSDIGVIVQRYRSRTFGFASRNFYAQFLAARRIAHDHESYFGSVARAAPLELDTVRLPFYLDIGDLERVLGVDAETVAEYNPALRDAVLSAEKRIPRGYALRLPAGTTGRDARRWLAAIPAARRYDEQRPSEVHRVARGDTLSGIAARYSTSVRTLVALNGLSDRDRIYPGQVLHLPTAAAAAPRAPREAGATHRVARGDTLSGIAARYGVAVRSLAALNGLSDRDRIYPGQVLRLSAAAGAAAPAPSPPAAPQPEAAASVLPASLPGRDNPLWSRVEDDTIVVTAAETLGHFADWLGIPTQRLRDLNGLAYGRPLQLRQRVRLDFSRVSPESFVQRRVAYHRAVRREFFSSYRVTGTIHHTVRRGESLWVLCHKVYAVPTWLLYRYNPQALQSRLQPGSRLTIPVLEPHSPS